MGEQGIAPREQGWSPHITRRLKGYGDYVFDFKQITLPLEAAISLSI